MFRNIQKATNTGFTILACTVTLAGLVLPRPIRAEERTWIYDGAELFHALTRAPTEYSTSGELRHRKLSAGRARAYISGVADATQGQKWCNPGNISLNELTDQVFVYLDYLPAARLKENAAVLVEEVLYVSFPCQSNIRK